MSVIIVLNIYYIQVLAFVSSQMSSNICLFVGIPKQ